MRRRLNDRPAAEEIVRGRKQRAAFVRIAPTSKYDDTKRDFGRGRVGFRKRVLPSGRVVWVPVQEQS
jgi:hypothetical protein